MKNYEHMMIAVEECLCHEIAAAICLENYRGKSLPKAFQKAFEMFSEYRKDFEQNQKRYEKDSVDDRIRFQMKCRKQREEILDGFLKDLKAIRADIDYGQEVKRYLEKLDKENVQTPEMVIGLYPMLITQIRKKEEKANKENERE